MQQIVVQRGMDVGGLVLVDDVIPEGLPHGEEVLEEISRIVLRLVELVLDVGGGDAGASVAEHLVHEDVLLCVDQAERQDDQTE